MHNPDIPGGRLCPRFFIERCRTGDLFLLSDLLLLEHPPAGDARVNSGDDRWTARLAGRDAWDSQAMIDLCTGARPGSDQEILARRLQRLEMRLLLDATVDAIITGR